MTIPIGRREFAMSMCATLALRPYALPRRTQLTRVGAIHIPDATFLGSLAEIMEIAGVPAVAMAVVQGGRTEWTDVRGLADITANQAPSSQTLWPAASLSKPVFTFAALHLVDEGKLDLDKPLKYYVPDHAPDDPRGNTITARHVLSHSSGLMNWRNRADQQLIPDFAPGARFQYSGEGFYYLQRAVEHIAGMGFEQFMQERLLGPLGMTSSTYSWRKDMGARVVTGYDRGQPRTSYSKEFAPRLLDAAERQGRSLARFTHEELVAAMQSMSPVPTTLPNSMIPNSAGSLITTPADYAAFLVEFLAGGTSAVDLKPATLALMATQHTRINSALGWGLGIGTEQQGSGTDATYLWHWGDNGAWKNFVLAHPASRSAIVVFTNGTRGLNVAQRIITAATGESHAAFLWL